MSEVKIINKIIYYSVTDDLSFTEHDSFMGAGNTPNRKFLLKRLIGSNPVETNNHGTIHNYATTLHLLNADESELEFIEENEWKLKLDHFGFTYGYSFNKMWVKFIDSNDYQQTEEFSISIEAFILAYQRFQRLNKFKGYKLAKVSIENEELQITNKLLKEQVSMLAEENRKLKDRLSEMA